MIPNEFFHNFGVIWCQVGGLLVFVFLAALAAERVISKLRLLWWLCAFVWYGRGKISTAKRCLRDALSEESEQ